MDDFQELEALFKVAEGWKLDLCDILGHADGLDIIFFIVLDLLIIGPAHHTDNLVSLKEGNVLDEQKGTRGTK